MDFQNRAGGKTGMGGVASASESNRDKNDRTAKMIMETINPDKDPYLFKNHMGKFECKLCKTLHDTVANYLCHTQATKHAKNLSIRKAETEKSNAAQPALPNQSISFKNFVPIGLPGYKYTRERDNNTGCYGLMFQIDFKDIATGVKPMFRIMSAYEQKCEPPNNEFQYLIFAAEPYSNLCFKIPNKPIDKDSEYFFSEWNKLTNEYFLQIPFRANS